MLSLNPITRMDSSTDPTTHHPIRTIRKPNSSHATRPLILTNKGLNTQIKLGLQTPITDPPTRPKPPADPNSKPQCQICSKIGHVAKACYFRYDPSYRGKPAHYHAYVAQPQSSTASSSEWVLDCSTTKHVMNDLNNLFAFFNYEGNDSLQIGNGASLPILHISSSTLSFSFHSLSLTKILHVPKFSKNLLSVSQLLFDNPHLTIEFSNFIIWRIPQPRLLSSTFHAIMASSHFLHTLHHLLKLS